VVIDEALRHQRVDTTKIACGGSHDAPQIPPGPDRHADQESACQTCSGFAWWAAGGKEEAHARWPYSGAAYERETFGGGIPGGGTESLG